MCKERLVCGFIPKILISGRVVFPLYLGNATICMADSCSGAFLSLHFYSL